MSEIIMGSSGFKYMESTITRTAPHGGNTTILSRTCIIKNIKTDKILFSVIGKRGESIGRGTRAKRNPDVIGIKRFLGLDNRYYYIEVSHDKTIWGQIQSSGAVITEDRTIIKQLDFFPMNIEIPTVPIIESIPIKSTLIESSVLITPIISKEKEVKWIEQIMNQINQIINQINQAIQSIINQLKQKK